MPRFFAASVAAASPFAACARSFAPRRSGLLATLLWSGGVLGLFPDPAQGLSPLLQQVRPCTERLDATFYHPSLAGELMANGQLYDPRNPRIASSNRHRLGTLLLLRRVDGTAAVRVQVMDRGSSELGLDLSEAAFQHLGPLWEGRIPVCVEVLG
jgi:rare lipoprotein A (peptidoglycan hydrolase)